MNFKIGQKVVALTNPPNFRSQIRIKGNIYSVIDAIYCIGCGCQMISIGGGSIEPTSEYMTCKCGREFMVGKLHYTRSVHFAPLDNLEWFITEAVEKEDYETAQLLHDILNETHQEL